MAAFEAVDYVVVFEETRAQNIIRELRPDVFIKGADWRGKAIDGSEFVQSYGGEVVIAEFQASRGPH